jgi:hypothetical protein
VSLIEYSRWRTEDIGPEVVENPMEHMYFRYGHRNSEEPPSIKAN